MMDVRYKRDLNSNYMIMTDAEKREEIYEDRMITENRIYGFLPCVEQKKEKQTEYFYEITGRQSMELLYERRKVSYEQLVELLKDLLQISMHRRIFVECRSFCITSGISVPGYPDRTPVCLLLSRL